jgi:hypothetical protein
MSWHPCEIEDCENGSDGDGELCGFHKYTDKLKSALAEYGSHKLGCWAYTNKIASCNCGFREFEPGIEPAKEEK